MNLRLFTGVLWKHLGLPLPTPVQLDVCDYAEKGPRRRIVMGYRGMGKSWIASSTAAFRLVQNPDINILVLSASGKRAEDFTQFLRRLINEVPMLTHLAPSHDQRDAATNFDVAPAAASHAPTVRASGIMSQLTGGRADLVIMDDVEIPNNSETIGMREKLAERLKEVDAILKPGGEVLVLGTPQAEATVYDILRTRGYDIRVWPSQFPAEGTVPHAHFSPTLANYMIEHPEVRVPAWNGHGQPTDPKRFNEAELSERELSYGKSGYARQFLLDTSISDLSSRPLRLSSIPVVSYGVFDRKGPREVQVDADGNRVLYRGAASHGMPGDRLYLGRTEGPEYPWSGCVVAIDPSGKGRDETAAIAVRELNGTLYLVGMYASTDGYTEEVMESITKLCRDVRANLIRIEQNFGGGMFSALLARHLRGVWPCRIEELRSKGKKEDRILDILEPVVNARRLVVSEDVLEYDSVLHEAGSDMRVRLQYQLTRIERKKDCLKWDDRVDALAMAVQYFMPRIKGVFTDQLERTRQDDALREWASDKMREGGARRFL